MIHIPAEQIFIEAKIVAVTAEGHSHAFNLLRFRDPGIISCQIQRKGCKDGRGHRSGGKQMPFSLQNASDVEFVQNLNQAVA